MWVEFTYSVTWIEDDTPFSARMDKLAGGGLLPSTFEVCAVCLLVRFGLVRFGLVAFHMVLCVGGMHELDAWMRERGERTFYRDVVAELGTRRL